MTAFRTIALAAGIACATIVAAMAPAQAGQRTGTWKYSPEEVEAAQQAQRQRAWQQRRYPYGAQGYDRGYDRSYGRGYGRPNPRPYGYGRVYPQPYGDRAPVVAGPQGGQGKYGQ